jgi:hypothetical protein
MIAINQHHQSLSPLPSSLIPQVATKTASQTNNNNSNNDDDKNNIDDDDNSNNCVDNADTGTTVTTTHVV